MSFWQRNLAFAKLAIVTNMEYRMNYFTDVVLQPLASTLIEITLWYAVFASVGSSGSVVGFSREYYLAYAVWAAFISRVTANWMYEFRMTNEVEMGTINTLLARPVSFYEYYLSQFMGYKVSTVAFSLLVPMVVVWYWNLPTHLVRLVGILPLLLCYLVMLHTLSFCVACLAFSFNRVSSITVAKNLTLWILSGELFPLDLIPDPWRNYVIALPFSSAVYIPVGYITGRFAADTLLQGYLSVLIGTAVFGACAAILWRRGMLRYAGTGA